MIHCSPSTPVKTNAFTVVPGVSGESSSTRSARAGSWVKTAPASPASGGPQRHLAYHGELLPECVLDPAPQVSPDRPDSHHETRPQVRCVVCPCRHREPCLAVHVAAGLA